MSSATRELKNLVKKHQLLSAKQNTITIDEHIISLYNIACECQLNTMHDDFMFRALFLGINDANRQKKLSDNLDRGSGLGLEQAIKK